MKWLITHDKFVDDCLLVITISYYYKIRKRLNSEGLFPLCFSLPGHELSPWINSSFYHTLHIYMVYWFHLLQSHFKGNNKANLPLEVEAKLHSFLKVFKITHLLGCLNIISQLTLFFKVPGYFWPGFLGMEADGHSRTTDVFSDVKVGLNWSGSLTKIQQIWIEPQPQEERLAEWAVTEWEVQAAWKVFLTHGLSAWPFSNTKDVMLELQCLGNKENERQCLKGWPIQTWELCFWSRTWLHLSFLGLSFQTPELRWAGW